MVHYRWKIVCGVLCLGLLAGSRSAVGQSSSVFGDPRTRTPITMADSSWTYEMPPEARQFRLHDQLTVMVSEKSIVSSQGQIDRRKQATFDALLSHWVLLSGAAFIPDPQTAGSPEVTGSYNNTMQAKGDLKTSDTMTFSIAVSVVDIRPNGYLVVEGRRTINNDGDTWEQSLTGVVRPADILPNNTVKSESVADLRILKRDAGQVRDSYRRGWLFELMDKYQPF